MPPKHTNRKPNRPHTLGKILAVVFMGSIALLVMESRVLTPYSKGSLITPIHNQMELNASRILLTRKLPAWLQRYISWHASIRSNATAMSDPRTQFLIVTCVRPTCGGLADRLRNMPFYLLLADRTERVLLIWWTRPYGLEEFLVPPLGGLDWRLPKGSSVSEKHLDPNRGSWCSGESPGDAVKNTNELASKRVVFCRLNNNDNSYFRKHGYDDSQGEELFGEIFRALFTPAPPLAELVQTTMTDLGLTPNEFAAVHLRARYPMLSEGYYFSKSKTRRNVDADGMVFVGRAKDLVVNSSIHAIAVASELVPGGAVYFASDTNEAVRYVTEHSGTLPGLSVDIRVVGMVTRLEKFHIDRKARIGWRKAPPSAFYPAFVDILILSMARCIAIGFGGYGEFAGMVNGDNCTYYHQCQANDTVVPCSRKKVR